MQLPNMLQTATWFFVVFKSILWIFKEGSACLRVLFFYGFSYKIIPQDILFLKNETIIWLSVYNKRLVAAEDEKSHSCISGLKFLKIMSDIFHQGKTESNYCFIMKVCTIFIVAWIGFLTSLSIAWPVLKKMWILPFMYARFSPKQTFKCVFSSCPVKKWCELRDLPFCTLKEKRNYCLILRRDKPCAGCLVGL